MMYKQVGLIVVVLLLLVALVVPISAHKEHGNRKFLQKSEDGKRYAVIIDAGSSGTRVHVFSFDGNLDLVPLQEGSEELELFVQRKPGLSAYANDPQAAANSIMPLLEAAERVIPEELRSDTPVRVGATAGLRLLDGDKADKILEAVRDLLKNRGTLKYEENSVSVLTGSQEGYDMWITTNFLLGNLGKEYGKTAGVVDLGGASVQMAYAISQTAAANAPSLPSGEDPYINKLTLKEAPYYVYVHSYLHYGKYAARVEILKASDGATHPCILAGYDGIYHYGGEDYKVSASPEGPSLLGCRRAAFKALKTKEQCNYDNCTFGGAWSGGGGAGENLLFISSAFHGTASKAGIIDLNLYSAKVIPKDFLVAAKHACGTKFEDAASTFPLVDKEDLPFLCMDIVYQYTLLVNGFDILPRQEITVANSTIYHNSFIQLAWPLGTAVEAMSSTARLSSF